MHTYAFKHSCNYDSCNEPVPWNKEARSAAAPAAPTAAPPGLFILFGYRIQLYCSVGRSD